MCRKRLLFCLTLFFIAFYGFTQPGQPNNLVEGDTSKVNTLLQQSKESFASDPAKAIDLALQAKELAEKINFFNGQATALKNIGIGYYHQGKYLEALGFWRESLKMFEELKDDIGIANLLNNIGVVYIGQDDHTRALEYLLPALALAQKTGDKMRIFSALNNIGTIYYNKKDTASKAKALNYFITALPLSEAMGNKDAVGVISENIGEIYMELNQPEKALKYFEKCISVLGDSANSLGAYNGIAKLYLKKGDYDQALTYHNKALSIAERSNNPRPIQQTLRNIANLYAKQNDFVTALNYYNRSRLIADELKAAPDLKDIYSGMAIAYTSINDYKNAFKYQTLYSNIKDTIYNTETDRKLGSLQFQFDMQKRDDSVLLAKNVELQKLRFEKFTYQNRFKLYILLGGFAVLLMIVLFLFRSNRQKQKAKSKIEQAYSELKDTQQQLIQREKMASLGELTAGIAHEIQNPLNFVNNFSEVSNELIDEMHAEIEKGNTSEIKQIAADIKQNLDKINHHGKRADAIVKGMLQHSRSNTGVKAPTDINALTDEYLRLAYHGLRAKDKTFNATMKKDYDESIGNINIIPQDIGRVILNLIINAFYAVTEKKKKMSGDFDPTVSVSTKKINGKVEIKVKDNGDGIPQRILDKIFQPFFTTKPTGEGTGLGLSLSYDIVKAHRGELKVETKEGETAEFIILLPVN